MSEQQTAEQRIATAAAYVRFLNETRQLGPYSTWQLLNYLGHADAETWVNLATAENWTAADIREIRLAVQRWAHHRWPQAKNVAEILDSELQDQP